MADDKPLLEEPLDQGINTGQDISTLEPGELAKADNVVYWPGDKAIRKIRGRTTYGTISSTYVWGLRYLAFDSTNNIIVAMGNNGTYYYSPMTTNETGSFNSFYVGSAPLNRGMEAIQYNNRHYLLNGTTPSNVVVKDDYTTRIHGLAPVTDRATLAGVTGSWSATLGVGYYFFITTEVIDPGKDSEVESTNTVPDGLVPSFQITTSNIATTTIQITRPGGSGATSTINPTATEWRVYMAGPFADQAPVPVRNLFKLVSKQDIANTTVNAGNIIIGTLTFPTTNSVVSAGWTNPNNAQANDNVGTTTTTSGAAQLYRTFGLAASGTISGIEVLVKAKATIDYILAVGRCNLDIRLTSNAGGAYFSVQSADLIALGISHPDYKTFTFGSNTYNWGKSGGWTTAEVNSANFGVSITVNKTGTNMPTVDVDYVAVKIYTVGGASNIPVAYGSQFATISISTGGILTVLGSHGPPPVATTGDVFEDQMVLNDITDPSIVRYSLANQVDYFPSVYFLNFETRETDQVTFIRRLGNKLLVAQKTQIFRINYLPRESDAEFDRGRCYEPISTGFGITGPQAATLFSPPEGPTMLAYVSYSGIHITDGFQVKTVTDNLDWDGIFGFTFAGNAIALSNAVLIDYPNKYWLVFYYPGSSPGLNNAFIIHYHPSHIRKDGAYKITGPISVPETYAASLGRTTNLPVWMSGGATAKVYVEDRGYTDSSGLATAAVDIRTREIYPYGMGKSTTVEHAWLRHDQDTSPGTATGSVTLLTREFDNAQIARGPKTFTTAQAGVAEFPWKVPAEGVQVKITEPGANAPIRISNVILDVYSHGKPESR